MTPRYFLLAGLSAVFLTAAATVSPAQNVNSSSSLLLSEQPETPVAPSTPGTGPGSLTNETTGTNPLTGLPCSGEGALAVNGAGELADSTNPPPGSVAPVDQGTIAEPSLSSVFGPTSSLGAC